MRILICAVLYLASSTFFLANAQTSKPWHLPKCKSLQTDISIQVRRMAEAKVPIVNCCQGVFAAAGSGTQFDPSLHRFIENSIAFVYRDTAAAITWAKSDKFIQDCMQASKL